jgi:hypothetical protein
MSTTTYELSSSRSSAGRTILWGGLIAGILDITGACVVSWIRRGVPPVRVFQSVASGVYGAASSTLGAKTAILGLVFTFSSRQPGLLFITSPAENSASW